ncbi:TonB-dependent receptor [Novosphingopyxis sp.]|uniref:TonB-dependent receptor n=1 Tax=Novosphingopyxis sp. TaxID=2709690 RepID=UPI003B5A4E23
MKTARIAASVCSLLWIGFTSAVAYAQDAAQDQPADQPLSSANDTIIVSGRGLEETPGTPAYGSVLLVRESLLSTGSGRIEDALSNVAGFQQFRRSDSRSSNPSAQGATLRALGGNATSRALVLLDGVPMADPFFGYIPFSAIAPERLASARITRGGGSGAFGAGAVAGTIELESAGPDQLDVAEIGALINDRAETEASALLAPRLGAGFAVISARWDRGQGFYTTPGDQRVPASARARYDSYSLGLRGAAPITPDIELQARGLGYADHRTLRFDGADSTSSGQDASLRLVGKGRWQFDVLGYVQARDFTNIVISSTRFVPVLDQRSTPSTGIGGKIEIRPPTGAANTLRLGSDLRIADGQLFEDAISAFTAAITARRNAGGRNSDLGFYVEDDLVLGALTLTAGARADRWSIAEGFFQERDEANNLVIDNRYADRSGWDGSFRAGALYRATGALSLRAAAYTGLRVPTLNELYRPFVVFPVVTKANEKLRNERLRGVEIGIDYTPAPQWRLALTAFDNRLCEAIANVTLAPDLRQRRNIDAVEARGIEASASARLDAFRFTGSAAWTDSRTHGSGFAAGIDGFRPAQTPGFAASGTIGITPSESWSLSATLRHVGRQYEDDLNTDILPAATTLDAFAEIAVTNRFALVLRGENLFDEDVFTRNQGGSIDLGASRTVWIGLRAGLGR